MLPNLVIAGVPKAGTTSLFNYLASHPAVCGSQIKETGYFAAIQYGEPMAPLKKYERYFDACRGYPVAMEATPGYMQGGRIVADEINRTLPNAQILISLREPVSRLISFFRFQKSTLQIDSDLDIDAYVDRCLSMSPEQFARRGVFRWTGLYGGSYGAYLAPWLEVFGERCGIVYFEELRDDPEKLTDRTLEWLGLDAAKRESLGGEVHNRTIKPRNHGLQRAGLFFNRRFERFWHRHPEIKRRIRGAYHRVNAAEMREEIPASSLRRLGELYTESNRRTAALLRDYGHHSFPTWLEDCETSSAEPTSGLPRATSP